MDPSDIQTIRQLFDDYIRMYSSRDDRLTTYFSEDFSGFTGGGKSLVKDRQEWIAITRQDFTEIKDPIRIELKDLAIQSLADTIGVATGYFTINLPIEDHILSRETARLVLIFRKESAGWKISHSSISIPYHLVREGEVYPLKELVDRNQFLEELVAERTIQLSEANDNLHQTNKALAREIAEHNQAEAALQHSSQKWEAIISGSPDGIGIVSLDGEIQLISDKLMIMHGYPVEEKNKYIGRSIFDFIDSSSHKMLAENIRKLLSGESDHKLTEYRAIKKDNSLFYIDVNSTVLLDPNGNPESILYVERDITERKRAEAEKESLESQNRQLQKSESLGRMAGAIAHHFNNQLQAVMGNLDLAMEGLPLGENSVNHLTAAMQAACKAAEVSGLMLTYLGQTPGKHQPIDMSEACRQSLTLFQAAAPKGMIFITDFPASGPVIHANAGQIQQVLTNLVTNAWEAAGENQGAISLAIKTVSHMKIPASKRFPVDWLPRENIHACLEVGDTGHGIPDRDIENLFDPFFTTKFTGRGLGLAAVLGIVRALHGVVTVESEPGRGSIFRVFLPISAEEVPLPSEKSVKAREMEGGGTVLLIEDEEQVRDLAGIMLTRLGYTVLEAKDGVDAMEKFQQHQEEIRFVFSDLTMPRMDGWETLAALRKLSPNIPVILSSGYSEAQVLAGEHPERPNAFLGKPYQLKGLSDTINRVLS